ncbi:activator of stress genes 1 [Podospora fimiseda]|uniref:Activator of stress genes 1 n=1 Tax=Podospora fimiseda TaxID=252190 RepID=A0AAN7BL96_9PEZI|nr:activator of stress genes 1 [Podospora fimiseda]
MQLRSFAALSTIKQLPKLRNQIVSGELSLITILQSHYFLAPCYHQNFQVVLMKTMMTKQPRTHVFQACTRCKAGKVRCDGQTPTCSPCAVRNRACEYPVTRRMRGQGKNKKRMEALEERLAAMETKLQKGTADTTNQPGDITSASTLSTPESTPVLTAAGIIPPFDSISDRFARWNQEASTKPLERIVLSAVAPQESEKWLLQVCLDEICSEITFLDQSWVMKQLNRPDALTNPESSWQCLLNALIANAILLKTHNSSFNELAPQTWAFFRNSYAILPELIIQSPSLNATRAILVMALFMRHSGDSNTTFNLLSMAIRIQNLSAFSQSEDQTRLFWTTFILDAEMSLNMGFPPAHSFQSSLSVPEPPTSDIIFHLRYKLALIQHKLTTHLLSPSTQPSDLSTLEDQLTPLYPRIPTISTPLISLLLLHLQYFTTLSTLSWAYARLLSSSASSSLSSHYKSLCRTSAQSIINIFTSPTFPSNLPISLLYRILSYPLTATLILLGMICKQPTLPSNKIDISLLSQFLGVLDNQMSNNNCDSLERIRDAVSKCISIADDAVNVGLEGEKISMPVNPALWPLSIAGGETGKSISLLLTCEAFQPMYLIQSLMGNTVNRDTENAKKLGEILGVDLGEEGSRYGGFVPGGLVPGRWGFVFGRQR